MSYADAVLADAPWGFWQLTEPAGPLANTGTGASALAVTGAPAFAQPGPDGSATAIAWPEGTAVYAASTATVAADRTVATLEVWFKVDVEPTAVTPLLSCTYSPNNISGRPVEIYLGHDRNVGARWGDSSGDNFTIVSPLNAASIGEWHHLVLRVGGGTGSLRLDGVDVASGSSPLLLDDTGKVWLHTGSNHIAEGGAVTVAYPAVWWTKLDPAITDAHITAMVPAEPPAPVDYDRRWWTHRLAAALGLDPDTSQPVVEVRTWNGAGYTVDPDLSSALAGYTVTYGRADVHAAVEALQATLTLATGRVPATPALAARLQVGFSEPVATALGLTADEAVRFTGEVTEPAVTHDTGLTRLVCVGRLGRGYRRPVDATVWPAENDGDRVGRVLTAIGATIGTVDAGTVTLAAPGAADTAAGLVEKVTRSTPGQVVEQPHGAVDWHAAEHRRGAPLALTLPSSDVLRQVTWSQRMADLVNDLDVKLATGDVVTITDPASSHPDRYGPYPATADTILTSTAAGRSFGTLIVGRRSEPAWRLPDLTVDLIRTVELVDLPAVLQLRHGSKLGLTGLPVGCPIPDAVFVEGWTETAAPRTWRLTIPVTDPIQSGVSPRWIDYPDDAAYQWQDLQPALSWLDLARTDDPADTI